MTVDVSDTHPQSKDVALTNEPLPWEQDDDSLGEIRDEDIPTPRLKVLGETAQFENSDTGEIFDELEVVILGIARSRTFWGDRKVEDGLQPLCRSLDSEVGYPNEDEDIPRQDRFPWHKSNFTRDKAQRDEGGNIILPCKECIFSQWNDAENKPSPCSENLNLPVFYKDAFDNMSPAILTFKRSGFRNTMRYLGAMKAAKKSPYQFYTKITLHTQTSGEVTYSVPKFHKIDMTDPGPDMENWRMFHAMWIQTRDFLRRPRAVHVVDEEPDREPDIIEPEQAPKAKAAPKAKPKPKAEVSEEPAGDWQAPDDDDPMF